MVIKLIFVAKPTMVYMVNEVNNIDLVTTNNMLNITSVLSVTQHADEKANILNKGRNCGGILCFSH
jgi:hypothetical protein